MLSSLAASLRSSLWQHLLTVVYSAQAYLSPRLITVIVGICVKCSRCLIMESKQDGRSISQVQKCTQTQELSCESEVGEVKEG